MNTKKFSQLAFAAALPGTTETDMLPGGATGFDVQGCDMIVLHVSCGTLTNAISTITLYTSVDQGGVLIADAVTQSCPAKVGAANGTMKIVIRGYSGGNIRLTGNPSGGTSSSIVDIGLYQSPSTVEAGYFTIVNGQPVGQSLGGTIAGNLSQSGGTVSLTANGASTFTTTSGNLTLDPTGTLALGPTNATAINVGASAVKPNFPGGLTITAAKAVDTAAAGALNIGPTNATSMVIGAAGYVPSLPGGLTIGAGKTIDATSAGAISFGTSTATSIAIGKSGVTTTITGGLTQLTGAVSLTSTGAAVFDGTTSITIGGTSATSIVMGKAAVPVDFKGGIQHPSGDAGAGATSGTVNARSGTFTVSTGTTYTLTNSTVLSTDQCLVSCLTASPGAYCSVVVCTSNTITFTFSASLTSIKWFFLVIGQGG